MKAFHSMTSKVANILSPLSGFVWALRPEARKKCCSITDIYVFVSMGHSWHASWVSKWSRHHLLEWVTPNEKPVWWGSLPEAQNLCLQLSPKGLDLPEANSLQDQSQWLRNGSPLTRSVQGSTGGADIKLKLDFPWGCYIFSHIRIIPEDVFFHPETILIYSIS